MRRECLIGLLLAALTLGVYWPVRHFEFVEYDDPIYVTDNAQVTGGLTWTSFQWALTSPVVGNWHPVTTLSHILTCQFFGTSPGPHHLVNALLHAANALLLFVVLRRMTNRLWPAAVIAALFALHPLRVESVAWVAERKDVLSGFFFLLTLWAYARYVQKAESANQTALSGTQPSTHHAPRTTPPAPAAPRSGKDGSRITHHASRLPFRAPAPWYLLTLLFFALGLMSKPMLVTLPFLLLLLDFWPLHRFPWPLRLSINPPIHPSTNPPLGRLLLEKLPFLALSVLFCIVTLLVQHSSGAVRSDMAITPAARLANAAVSYVRYLGKMVWPTDLAVIYPHPANGFWPSDQWPDWQVAAAALLLVAVTALCLLQAARRPWFAVGWFWYLGTMVPVIGLVQVGEQAMADRYTYIPLIGPVLVLVWLGFELVTRGNPEASAPASQTAASPAKPNPFSLTPRFSGVRAQARALLTLSRVSRLAPPGSAPSHRRSIAVLAVPLVLLVSACAVLTHRQLQHWRSTIPLFEHTIAVTPANPSAQFGLGVGLEKAGEPSKAMVQYRVALLIYPGYRQAHYNLGQILRKQGNWEKAAECYRAVLAANPNELSAHLNLAGTLTRLGRAGEAIFHFDQALRLDPNSLEALNNLAWLLATSPQAEIRDGTRAVQLAERACQVSGFKQIVTVGTLAAAYAEAGRFADALVTAQQACELASASGDAALLERNRELLQLYRSGKPCRDAD